MTRARPAPPPPQLPSIPAPGAHGGDGVALARALGCWSADVLDLSASLNPAAPDPKPVLAAHLDAIGRYPDPRDATAALARAMGVAGEQLLLTNGGAEAIALVAAECGPGWVEEPDFSLYRRHLAALDPSGARWRSNPHNPSGRLAPVHERAGVWDEAFWPLATGTWTRGDHREGAVVVGSLTKLLACPGLRVGYVLAADAGLINRLGKRQPQWALNGLACAALPELLGTVDLPAWAKEVTRLRKELVALLINHGLPPTGESDANWVLVHSTDLRERLAPHGICVRDCASFGLAGTVRIAVPDDAGRHRLEVALCQA